MAKFKLYAVFLYAKEGNERWLYEITAANGREAYIQARLRHLGKGLPEVDPTRYKVREV